VEDEPKFTQKARAGSRLNTHAAVYIGAMMLRPI